MLKTIRNMSPSIAVIVLIGCASFGVNHSPEVLKKGEFEWGIGTNFSFPIPLEDSEYNHMANGYGYLRYGLVPGIDGSLRLIFHGAAIAGRIEGNFSLINRPILVTASASAGIENTIDDETLYSLSGALLFGSDTLWGGLGVVRDGILRTYYSDYQAVQMPFILLGTAIGRGRVKLATELGLILQLGDYYYGSAPLVHLNAGLGLAGRSPNRE